MSTRPLIIVFVALFSTALYAEEKQPLDLDDPKPLISQPGYHMKNDDTNETELEAFKTNGGSGDSFTDYCNTLRASADTFKRQGKIQKHWAAMERYKFECMKNFDRPLNKVP